MEYNRLGKSGLRVSQVCLGTMTFGREADRSTSFDILDYFVNEGFNFIDTANAYSKGLSEEILGEWMKDRGNRNDLVIATKVYGRMGEGPNEGGLSRIHILQAVEASLERLGTDVIDLYQIHRWDPATPPEETIEALNDLVRAGKVRYIACSNLKAWHLAEFLRIADQRLYSRFVSIQPVYNALNRGIELEVLPLCEKEGLGVIPYNPLAGGMLTGKYARSAEKPKGSRLEAFEMYSKRYYTGEALDIASRFVEHAKEVGVTPAQLSLAWVLAEPRVTAPIIGARNIDQITDTLKGVTLNLDEEARAAVPSVVSGRWVGIDPVYDREY